MRKEDIEYFKKLLSDWLDQLLNKADGTVVDLLTTRDYSSDLIDQASLDRDRSFTLRIRDRESRLINKIQQALENIENGTYGICEECGEDISVKRLRARPVTTYCIDCKRRKEAMERMAV